MSDDATYPPFVKILAHAGRSELGYSPATLRNLPLDHNDPRTADSGESTDMATATRRASSTQRAAMCQSRPLIAGRLSRNSYSHSAAWVERGGRATKGSAAPWGVRSGLGWMHC